MVRLLVFDLFRIRQASFWRTNQQQCQTAWFVKGGCLLHAKLCFLEFDWLPEGAISGSVGLAYTLRESSKIKSCQSEHLHIEEVDHRFLERMYVNTLISNI
jgi:hypothetical protein